MATDSKVCSYKPCSRTFYREKYDKQWEQKKYCNYTCQRHANALQHKLNRRSDNAGFKPRSAPEISNPRFWDGILTRNLA